MKTLKPHVMRSIVLLVTAFIFAHAPVSAIEKYTDPAGVSRKAEQLRAANPSLVKVHKLAVTPGGRDMLMIEIGKDGSSVPGVLVGANFSGVTPLATEAALSLASRLASDDAMRDGLTWYIIPVGNPDAHARFFRKPLWRDTGNDTARNDDNDDQTDEDGYNDLNGDGLITMMRVKAHDGIWMPVEGEPRLMRRADPLKGEKGIYKLYSEGIDDDGDGLYNEDPPGGVNINNNFPHRFKHFDSRSGLWPGSQPEALAVMKFAFAHPELAMVIAFGETNNLLSPPQPARGAGMGSDNIRLPQNFGRMLGVDVSRTYTRAEAMDLMKQMMPPGMEVTESTLDDMLSQGEVLTPMAEDIRFYNEISAEYKEYLKEKGVTGERLDPAKPEEGSFEEWAYYQLGLPVFTMDLWALPGLKDAGQKSPAEGARGDMRSPGRDNSSDEQKGDPKELAHLAFSDSELGGKGFVPWSIFNHPTLGELEIGGFVPFTDNTPPEGMVDGLLETHLPFIGKLAGKLPRLTLTEATTVDKGGGIYQVEVWLSNEGYLSFPTAMGRRNKVPPPAIIILEGNSIELLSGKTRTTVDAVAGMKSVKYTWLVRSTKKGTLTISLESKQAGNDTKKINIGG